MNPLPSCSIVFSELKTHLLYILITVLAPLYCSAGEIELKENAFADTSKFTIKNYYILSDTSGKASVDDIAERFNNGEAKLKKGSVFSSGYSDYNIWLAVIITNADSITKQMVMEVGDPHINKLELYKVSGTAVEPLGITGDLEYFYTRPIADNNFVFLFTLNPHERCTLLMKIDNKGQTNMVPFTVNTFADHYRSTVTEYLVWGVLTGVLLFVCVFSLLIYFSLKEKLFLFYSLYIILTLIWIWSNNGLGYQYLYPEFPQVMARIRFIAAACGIPLMLHIMQLFTGQSRDNSYFFRATNGVKACLFMLALIMFTPYDFTNDKSAITVFLIVSDVLILAAVFLLFAGLIEKIRQGHKSAYIYLFAVSVFFVSTILTVFVRLGILPASGFTLNIVYISILAEVLILAVALGQRYTKLSKEQQRLQLELESQKKDTLHRIEMAAVHERNRIAADLHDDIGSGISGLRLFSEMAERKNSVEELKIDTRKIAENAATIADKIREVVWILDSGNKNAEDFLLYIQQYGIRFFENSGMVFSMDIPIRMPAVEFNGGKQKQLLLAIKEIFNNALKHSGAARLECIIRVDDFIVISISDNGKGFDKAIIKGNGLTNIQNRIAKLNGSVEVKSDAGTTFTIRIPV